MTADEVLAAHFTLVDVPGAIETINLEGATGWTSPNPHPVLSLMRWTTTSISRLALEPLRFPYLSMMYPMSLKYT